MILTLYYTAVKVGSVSPETYYSIGHEFGTQVVLWVFEDGRLKTLKTSSGTIHSDYWPKVFSYYYGRYDPSTKQLSVVPPYRFKHRDVPSVLLTALEHEFPGAEMKFFNT